MMPNPELTIVRERGVQPSDGGFEVGVLRLWSGDIPRVIDDVAGDNSGACQATSADLNPLAFSAHASPGFYSDDSYCEGENEDDDSRESTGESEEEESDIYDDMPALQLL
jgi:hypothetical protein